jgi:hypothetical protein
MKRILTALLASLTALQVIGQVDLDTPEMRAGRAKYEAMRQAAEIEAEKISSVEVYKELERLDTARASRIARNPDSWIFGTDEDQRDYGFSAVLNRRRDNGEVAASFYFGIRNWKYCQALRSLYKDQMANRAADCWSKSLESFRVASAGQVPEAAFNIARMYENGFGVIASKYVAADWYVKSAEQYNKADSRDEALTSLEAALAAVPDHPAALRLRKIMLK